MQFTALALIASAIIIPLGIYAVKLLNKVNTQRNIALSARQKRLENIKESLDIIANAMLKGDCNHSEGVIRLAMLLAPLGTDLSQYSEMAKLYQTVKEMPTHEARRTLTKKERMRLDLERESTEAELESEIIAELPHFIEYIKQFGVK
ncbi:hypothetical protein BKG89_07580 [Rodentibacter caecimuris]|uniref:DUF2489 domain-containing protein n=2 Tax=Rodentibacter caecimuris TaxID=1796644 RepID=A0ABX3KZC3_9PAST|nr:hypothetical protein BKG89_07580 [Rodentibacter heylii]